ncbi:MAG: hypothetical protein II984_06140 [Clostridia bacterium]|nr:hypothetical protein [Clostridia bacterium]
MKKTNRIIYVTCFVVFLCIVVCTFFITISLPFLNFSHYKQLDNEINSLIDILEKEEICTLGNYRTYSAQEYYYNGTYSSISFVYCDINYEIDIVYLDSMYNIEVTFGMVEPNSLTVNEINGINKVLTSLGEFYETDVFSPDIIKENYFSDYFTKNYDNQKYKTKYIKTCDSFEDLCSYKLTVDDGAYTYRAHMNEKYELDFMELSVCYMTEDID